MLFRNLLFIKLPFNSAIRYKQSQAVIDAKRSAETSPRTVTPKSETPYQPCTDLIIVARTPLSHGSRRLSEVGWINMKINRHNRSIAPIGNKSLQTTLLVPRTRHWQFCGCKNKGEI